jgi:hypothetical protein
MNCSIKNIDAGDTIMTACLEYEEYTVSISLHYFSFLVTVKHHYHKLHTKRNELLWHIWTQEWNLEFLVRGFKQRITAVITLFFGKTLYKNQKYYQNLP